MSFYRLLGTTKVISIRASNDEMFSGPISVIESVSTPALPMALRLLEILLDGKSSMKFLLQSSDAHPLFAGLSECVRYIHIAPTSLACYILDLVGKIITIAKSMKTEKEYNDLYGIFPILRSIGSSVITLMGNVISESGKTYHPGSPTSFHQALIQSAIVCSETFDINLLETDKKDASSSDSSDNSNSNNKLSARPPLTSPVVLESLHPSSLDVGRFIVVDNPGVISYRIAFDERTSMNTENEFVQFFKDDSHKEFWGAGRYSGSEGLPGNFFFNLHIFLLDFYSF